MMIFFIHKDNNKGYIIVSSFLALLIMYIRFQHIHQYYKVSVAKVAVMNIIIFFIGLLSVLGFLLVGAFQVKQ